MNLIPLNNIFVQYTRSSVVVASRHTIVKKYNHGFFKIKFVNLCANDILNKNNYVV